MSSGDEAEAAAAAPAASRIEIPDDFVIVYFDDSGSEEQFLMKKDLLRNRSEYFLGKLGSAEEPEAVQSIKLRFTDPDTFQYIHHFLCNRGDFGVRPALLSYDMLVKIWKFANDYDVKALIKPIITAIGLKKGRVSAAFELIQLFMTTGNLDGPAGIQASWDLLVEVWIFGKRHQVNDLPEVVVKLMKTRDARSANSGGIHPPSEVVERIKAKAGKGSSLALLCREGDEVPGPKNGP